MLGMAKHWGFTISSPSNNRYMKLDNISSQDKTISSLYDLKIHNPIISGGHYDET